MPWTADQRLGRTRSQGVPPGQPVKGPPLREGPEREGLRGRGRGGRAGGPPPGRGGGGGAPRPPAPGPTADGRGHAAAISGGPGLITFAGPGVDVATVVEAVGDEAGGITQDDAAGVGEGGTAEP